MPNLAGLDINTAVAVAKMTLSSLPPSPEVAAALKALQELEASGATDLGAVSDIMASAGLGSGPGGPAGRAAASQPRARAAAGGKPVAAGGALAGEVPALTRGSGQERRVIAEGLPIVDPSDSSDLAHVSAMMDAAREALREASALLEQDPDNVQAREDRAEALNTLGDYEAAAEEASKALALAPHSVKALNARAYANNKRGQYAFALQDADLVVKLAPGNAMGHLNRAMALEGLGRMSEAIQEYVLAAQLDPAFKSLLAEAQARRAGPPSREAAPVPRAALWGAGLLLAVGLPLSAWAWRRSRAPRAVKVDVGRVIGGNYRIVKLIGEGGMGKVFEGFDTVIQRKVAVKVMHPALRQAIGDARLLEEARLVALARHPNIVEVFAVLQEGGEIFLVFELVAGRTLYELLCSRRRMSLPEAAHLLGQVAAGLDAAHQKRVIHRDLKPTNVVIANDGTAKLMDFGIAHRSRGAGGGETVADSIGTEPYMAPEQFLGAVSPESDLYALGVMAYELLTGQRPFDAPDGLERKRQGRFTPPSAAAPGLPPSVDVVLARALAPDPKDRFHSGAEFIAALTS